MRLNDIRDWWFATKPGDYYAVFGRGGAMDNGDKICGMFILGFILLLFILAFIA